MLSTLTRAELQQLTDQQFRQVQAQVQRLEQHGKQLAAALLQQRHTTPPPLSPHETNAIAFHLRAQPAAAQQLLQHLTSSCTSLATAAEAPLREHQQQQTAQQLRANLSIEADMAMFSPLVKPRLFGHELVDPALEAQLEAAATVEQPAEFVEEVRCGRS